jgi:DNA-directed RNA polymerase specialized sigma24 family protein
VRAGGGGIDGEFGVFADSVDDLLMLGEEECRVLSLLRQLPAAQREAMAWYYDGYPPREIAAIVGKPAATVRSELRLARARLRAELARDPVVRARWPQLSEASTPVVDTQTGDGTAAQDGRL